MLSPQAPLSTSPTLRRELRIRTIYSSLVIEGNKLDERAVSAIIDGKRVLGDRRDILEVENACAAYDLIPELDPHSLADLLRVHRVMMGGLAPDAGRFRSGNVGVFNGDTLIHVGLRQPTSPRSWEASSSGCVRRVCIRCLPRVSSTSSLSSATPFLTGMVGRGVSGTHYCCRGGVRCWPGCPSSPRSGGGRRTTTRPWLAPARPGRARISWSLCSKQSGKPYFRTRGQRVQRTRSAPVRLLSLGITRMPLSLSSPNILGARSGAPSAQSHSSKKKASSSVRGAPGRACGLSTPPDARYVINSPLIGVETPLLLYQPLRWGRQGGRR